MHTSSRLLLLAAVLCQVFIAGCASHPEPKKRSIRAAEMAGGITISPKDRATFVEELDRSLYDEDFVRGDEYTLLWKVTKYEPGNRALRYLVGFGAGKAHFSTEMSVLDAKKKVLCTHVAHGSEAFGLFGGSFDNAITESAQNVYCYAYEAVYPEVE